jgi:ubiquinone/menaquinone biosynthesis C-methylase UbiE
LPVFGGTGGNWPAVFRPMSFDPLARHYRWMELLLAGNKLQRCRTAFLNRVGNAQNILIAGEGNGRFLVECRRKFPAARIIAVDASARMLAAARDRLQRSGLDSDGVQFIHADALNWKHEGAAHDLIVTHFFLDCFPRQQLEQVVANLARSAAPGASWLLADFQVPVRGLRRYRALVIHALMYAFFRVATRLPARRLVPPDDFLKARNFVLQEQRTNEWGLLRSDLWKHTGHHSPPLAANSSTCGKFTFSPSPSPHLEQFETTDEPRASSPF